jgi:hypothetical protein
MKAATVKAWLEAYAEKHDLNEVSYNAKKRYLSLFFGYCVDSDLLESNPADKVEAREEDGRRKRVVAAPAGCTYSRFSYWSTCSAHAAGTA